MNRSVFREKALERLASPDNIQELIQITSTKSWLALLALFGLIVAGLAWAVFAKLPKTADGKGILIQSGGIAEINSASAGIIAEIKVEEGQTVKKNDTIAIIAQPELELQLKNALSKLSELKNQGSDLIEIHDLERTIDELKIKLTLTAYILSPYTGKIIELMAKNGQLIEINTPISSMEILSKQKIDLEAIIYISPEEGKKVTKGMLVKIAPSTVKVEEYGYVEGIVSKVSEYPSTRAGMMSVLGNPALVETFLKAEPPIAIFVILKESDNFSGFQWTSAKGPEIKINAGTLCDAYIEVDSQSPISLIFPGLK